MTNNKLWGGRFTAPLHEAFSKLNASFRFDRELLAHDVEGSIAWATAIAEAGVFTEEERERVVDALRAIEPPTEAEIVAFEDVHSFVESKLRDQLGDLAGKLHTGRSRNDQVATDLKLWLKEAYVETRRMVLDVAEALATRAQAEAATPMPGYTHLKQAEPVTFGHWCLANVEMLLRDAERLAQGLERGDVCPLGSGALAGTPVQIDRENLAHSLGFARATLNSLDGVSDRDMAVDYLYATSLLLTHLSRLSEDLILFSSDEFGFIELPDALATGSSRMPQKKNPDLLELTRGYAARSIGEVTAFLTLLKGLPLAYNKDLQLDKEPLFRTRQMLSLLLPSLQALVLQCGVRRETMLKAASSELLLATAAADAIAATGIPFREAHEIVSRSFAGSKPEVCHPEQEGVGISTESQDVSSRAERSARQRTSEVEGSPSGEPGAINEGIPRPSSASVASLSNAAAARDDSAHTAPPITVEQALDAKDVIGGTARARVAADATAALGQIRRVR